MASNTVEQIFVELLLNAKGYNKEADDAVKKSEKLEKGLGNTEKQSVKTNKSFDGLVGGLRKAVKGVAGLTAVIAAGTGLLKLAEEARKANDELNFLSKNLGMSSGEVKAWQGAAAAMGGSAQGMAGDMKALNSSMNDFVMTGESSMLPMFNTLGVSMVDAQGKVRGTNDVMLDLADSMSKMDREQAFLMGQKLGFDEGTINTLLQGRDAMQEMVDYHKQMYTSNKQELEASRKLSENQAKMSAHWDSMKLMMGNAIIPLLVKLSSIALKFFEFLQRHQKTVKTVFEGMAIFLGMLVVPLLGKALVAALLFMAPFLPFIATVGLLGAAFIALYQDYKVWAEGGESLFNWGAFSGYIDNAKFSTENLGKGFLHLIGDYKSWSEVASDGKSWLKLKGFIDENGVSLKTLRAGFIDLAGDIVKYAIPTLKGYASIFGKLTSGDFKGAMAEASEMTLEFGGRIWDAIPTFNQLSTRLSGAADIATGQPMGTLGSTSIMNNAKPSGNFTKDKAESIARVARNIGVDPNHLASVISFETGGSFNPAAKNPKSSATGLIQFMSGSGGTKGKYYGMNRDQFSSLSFDDQMKYVEKYFKERDSRFKAGNEKNNSVGDVYGAVTGYGYKQGTEAYRLNRVWDSNKNGVVEKGEMVQNPNFKKHQRSYFDGVSTGATQAQSTMPKNQIPASIAKPVTNNKSNNVEVNVNKIEVNTSSSTMTGAMGDAIKGLENKFYQFPMGPQ
jgi:hypothetical protein